MSPEHAEGITMARVAPYHTVTPSVRRWLSAARHPARRDGAIAAVLLVLPWALAWVLARHHRLDTTAVTIVVPATISLAALWLTWAAFRNASRPSADSGAGPGIMTSEPGSVVADRGGTAIGQVVYQQRTGVIGKPVRLGDPPPLLADRSDLLAELDARLTGGDSHTPRKVALYGLGGAGKTSVALSPPTGCPGGAVRRGGRRLLLLLRPRYRPTPACPSPGLPARRCYRTPGQP